MKRTLVEILAGMAVLVLLVSFHHRISRIDTQEADVANLRQLVRDAVTRTDNKTDLDRSHQETLHKLTNRLQDLESKLAEASADADSDRLRQELTETRLEADRFKAEIERDVTRTKELMDAYHKEFRALDRKAAASMVETQGNLEKLTQRFLPDPGTLSQDLLAPTVQLNGDDTVGSGTLVYSAANPKTQEHETYLLTSYHVVRNILADSATAKVRGISVTIYTTKGPVEERADMVSSNARIDAALLKLRGSNEYENLARILPERELERVQVWERIYAVGCPLGNDPIPTQGEISSTQNLLKGSNYWMINAPTYFGNSGGGVYLAETRELVGVFSKIYTHGRGNPTVVPHMGLCTPIDLIYSWLEEENQEFAFVLDAEKTRLEAMGLAAPAGN